MKESLFKKVARQHLGSLSLNETLAHLRDTVLESDDYSLAEICSYAADLWIQLDYNPLITDYVFSHLKRRGLTPQSEEFNHIFVSPYAKNVLFPEVLFPEIKKEFSGIFNIEKGNWGYSATLVPRTKDLIPIIKMNFPNHNTYFKLKEKGGHYCRKLGLIIDFRKHLSFSALFFFSDRETKPVLSSDILKLRKYTKSNCQHTLETLPEEGLAFINEISDYFP